MILLENEITDRNLYDLKDYKEDEMKPAVSNTMFEVMFASGTLGRRYTSLLLSLYLNKDYKYIYDNIEFVKDILDRENYHDKGMRVDLICKVDEEYINIEINNNKTEKSSIYRNIGYSYNVYKGGIYSGTRYNYNRVIQININNFTFKGEKREISEYILKDEENKILTDYIKIVQIYLPNIRRKWYNEKEELNDLEAFLMAINEHDSDDLEKLLRKREIMKEYRNNAKEKSLDTDIIGLYNKELEDEALKRMDREAYRIKGYESGLEAGMRKGKAEGKAEGEAKSKIEIAKKMINKNIDINIISECTGLSKDEIEKLK